MKILLAVLIAATFAFTMDSLAASPSEPSSHLAMANDTKTALTAAPLVYSRCDTQGNLYLRLDTVEPETPMPRLAITELMTNGQRGRVFRLPDSPANLQALEYFPAEDGRLYSAAWSESERAVYLLTFGRDGTLTTQVRLQSDYFIPRQLVVFKSGEAVVSGTLGTPGRRETPYTGVFDASGKLLRKLYEPEDEVSRQKAAAKEPGFVHPGVSGNRTVERGDIALGSDGNAYLLRATSPSLIYVISPRGEIVRKLHIDPPSGGFEVRWLRASNGKLAVYFVRQQGSYDGEIVVTDLEGKPLAAFTTFDDGIQAGLPGCYNGDSFSFLWGIQLRTAVAK